MTSERFDRFISPARARPALWRLILGMVLGVAIYAGSLFGVLMLARHFVGAEVAIEALQADEGAARPVPTLILLFTFAGMALGCIVAVAVLHRRGPRSLVGPLRPALRDFALAVGVVVAIYLAGIALWAQFYDAEPNLSPRRWLAFLPLTLLALLIQTGAEELVFRGYLMQQLAVRFRSALLWFWLPALTFGAIHYDPTVSLGTGLMLISSPMLFGILAADLTWRTGSLGAAWGFHFANNLIAIAILSTKGTITGLSLMLTPYGAEDSTHIYPLLAADMLLLLLAWVIVRRCLVRRG